MPHPDWIVDRLNCVLRFLKSLDLYDSWTGVKKIDSKN